MRRRSPARPSWLQFLAQGREALLADAVDLVQLVERREAALGIAVLDDPLGEGRADAVQLLELLGGGAGQAELDPGSGARPARAGPARASRSRRAGNSGPSRCRNDDLLPVGQPSRQVDRGQLGPP